MTTTLRQKILLVTAGCIAFLLILEGSLRLAGVFYKKYRLGEEASANAYSHDAVRILCLGDSFTFGIGAKAGYSYPEQLKKILNKKFQRKFIVYNAGVPGSNSSFLYNKLEENIMKTQPDIVIIMAGCNDNSNFEDSNYFLFFANSYKTYLYRLDGYLLHSKSYKLGKAIMLSLIRKLNLRDNPDKKVAFKKDIEKYIMDDGEDSSQKASDSLAQKAKAHFDLAKNYEKEYKFKLAVGELQKAIELNPDDSESYALLGFVYLHRFSSTELGIKFLRKAAELNPADTWVKENLAQAYYRMGYAELALTQLRELSYLNPENKQCQQLVKFGVPRYDNLKLFKATLEYDLKNICALVKSKNIELILLNYPQNWSNETLKEFAHKNRLSFVDNETTFRELENSQNYFAEDGHCNENGYYMIAMTIYNTLVSNGIDMHKIRH